MESSIPTVFTYSDFFLVCKFCLSDLQIMSLNSDHLRFIGDLLCLDLLC